MEQSFHDPMERIRNENRLAAEARRNADRVPTLLAFGDLRGYEYDDSFDPNDSGNWIEIQRYDLGTLSEDEKLELEQQGFVVVHYHDGISVFDPTARPDEV